MLFLGGSWARTCERTALPSGDKRYTIFFGVFSVVGRLFSGNFFVAFSFAFVLGFVGELLLAFSVVLSLVVSVRAEGSGVCEK